MTLVPLEFYDPEHRDTPAFVYKYEDHETPGREAAWPLGVFRLEQSSSAGAGQPIAGYNLYVPRVGTSPAVVDNRTTAPVVAPSGPSPASDRGLETLALPVADQAREVLAAMSLNKSQLAGMLRVSRPTLYEWLEGKEPNSSNAKRLSSLVRLLARAGITSANPLGRRAVRFPLGDERSTLLDLLSARTVDEKRVAALLQEAQVQEDRSDALREARENRLRALGFEEPTQEERKARLAANVAARDWPKG